MKQSIVFNPYQGKDIPWLLRQHANNTPDSVFFTWEPFDGEPKRWTYEQVHTASNSVATALSEQGISKGDFVLIHMNNCPEYLLAWHACAAIGAVAVTTNTRATASELAYFAKHSGVVAAITQPEFVTLVRDNAPKLEFIACTDTNSIEPVREASSGTLSFADFLKASSDFTPREPDPMLALSVMYTSGTTSLPKGVVWTHANALWGGQVGASHNCLGPDDIGLVFTPLCHTNAMSWAHLPILWSGSSYALQPKFSASRFWPVAMRHRCTWANVIPFALTSLATSTEIPKHNFRHWVVGAANIGPIEQLLGLTSVGAWGMTEVITHGTWSPTQLANPALSMGLPVPEYELKIVDENDKAVAKGETGLLKIRGQRGIHLFKEYLNDPDTTAKEFDDDGWFDTGDRVLEIDDGHLKFADRAKDMLKVGGENVAASEVEAVITSIDGVLETAVVAKSDPLRQEVPVAFVRAPLPSDELNATILKHCQEHLSDFKVPVEIIFVDDFPRVEMHKVSKAELRKML